MWVSLHQHHMQPTPHRGQGLFRLMNHQGGATAPYLYASHTLLTRCRYWGTERYCVRRSKWQYRDLDSQPVSQDGETKQRKTEMLTRAPAHSLPLRCACERWGVTVRWLKGYSFVDIYSTTWTPKLTHAHTLTSYWYNPAWMTGHS